jgi:hypothetical protein
MHARAVGSRAGCDDDDKAAHPPLGNCFCANNRRRSSTATSLVVTIALLYCRLAILSNYERRKFVDSSTVCANAPKEECTRVHHPKCEWQKFAAAVSGNVRTAIPLARPPPKVHTAKKCLAYAPRPGRHVAEGKCRHPDCIRPKIFLTFQPAAYAGRCAEPVVAEPPPKMRMNKNSSTRSPED